MNLVKTSYNKEDVTVLLKDLTGLMNELSTEDREKAIQSGVHYSEMLPMEKAPSKEYEALYEKALTDKKTEIAMGIARVAEIMLKLADGDNELPVIISLARAGIPVGILIKRYIKYKYGVNCPHYAISIIRDRGIDENAMNYIYEKEVVTNNRKVSNFFFVDGWTGKGAIKNQLDDAVVDLQSNDAVKWKDLSSDLFVLADPANITPYCGTHTDYLLPSACLNSTVSGLTSRTILNCLIDTPQGDFHGAVYFKKFESIDKSNEFIDTITKEFEHVNCESNTPLELEDGWCGMDIVKDMCHLHNISDYKKVKPGIGEKIKTQINEQISSAVNAEINRKKYLLGISANGEEFHLPSQVTKLGVNPIEGPSAMVILNNATFASNYKIDAVNVGGYMARSKEFIVCFEMANGEGGKTKYYCYSKQLPAKDQGSVVTYVENMRDACKQGYSPYWPYLMTNKYLENQ